ncbi:hypothetical protein AB833_29600 [Chromatiales bacterium (ex Bugula neritina AB1)]|nr:hypothetical protein AB833_29600 [Chromatiales bacterium (ex Bugula neritina AB1)]
MAGIAGIEELLKSMASQLQAGEFVFCTVEGSFADSISMNPLAMFAETGGLTLFLALETACQAYLRFERGVLTNYADNSLKPDCRSITDRGSLRVRTTNKGKPVP